MPEATPTTNVSTSTAPVVDEKQTPGEKLAAALAADQAAEATDAPVEAQPTLAQRLGELGFADVKDDSEAVERLLEAFKKQKEQYDSDVRYALDEIRNLKIQNSRPIQTDDVAREQISDTRSGWDWKPPAVDSYAVTQYRNADGSWKDGTPDTVKHQAAALENYRNAFANKFVADPENALSPLLEKKFNEYFDRKFSQVQSQTREQSARDKILTDNAWIFEMDPVTKRPLRSGNGDYQLSAEGKIIDMLVAEARDEVGIPTFAGQWKYAEAMYKARKASSLSPDQARAISDQKKQDLIARAAPGVQRAGSLPTPGAPPKSQNRRLTFGQAFAQSVQRDGVELPS